MNTFDNIWQPSIPIRRGVDWGPSISGTTGHKLTFSAQWGDISGVVFELTFKRGTQTILAMTEANSMINHSGTDIIYLTIPKATTTTLSAGPVRGVLLGTSGGVTSEYMIIETTVEL